MKKVRYQHGSIEVQLLERILGSQKDTKKREIVKLKLDFKADIPTCNGRIYTKECLKKAFRGIKKDNGIFILKHWSDVVDNCIVPLKKAIGMCRDYEILKDGEVFIHAIPVDNNNLRDCILSTYGFGNINRNNHVENFHLACFYLNGPSAYLAGDV